MHLIVSHLNMFKKVPSGLLQYIISMMKAWARLKNHLKRPTGKHTPRSRALQKAKEETFDEIAK